MSGDYTSAVWIILDNIVQGSILLTMNGSITSPSNGYQLFHFIFIGKYTVVPFTVVDVIINDWK